jgi:hypothetical protein
LTRVKLKLKYLRHKSTIDQSSIIFFGFESSQTLEKGKHMMPKEGCHVQTFYVIEFQTDFTLLASLSLKDVHDNIFFNRKVKNILHIKLI